MRSVMHADEYVILPATNLLAILVNSMSDHRWWGVGIVLAIAAPLNGEPEQYLVAGLEWINEETEGTHLKEVTHTDFAIGTVKDFIYNLQDGDDDVESLCCWLATQEQGEKV